MSTSTNSTNRKPAGKVTVELVDLTPAIAQEWLSRNTINRKVSAIKVREFATDMRNGAWHVDGDNIRFDWNGVMLNGQHRCLAVIESGVTIRIGVMTGLDPQARTIMDTGTKRSAAHALEFAGYDRYSAAIASTVRIALARENGYLQNALSRSMPTYSHSETIAWVQEHEQIVELCALASTTYRRIGVTRQSAFTYALYELDLIHPALAAEFVNSAAEFRTDGPTDPRAKMLDQFRAAFTGNRRRIEIAETIHIVFVTWNAWVEGRALFTYKPRGVKGATAGALIPTPVRPTPEFARSALEAQVVR
jgi:hypothetical protein